MILNALEGKPLPVYGDGQQVRDWLYVEDHCRRASGSCSRHGRVGETYNIGGAATSSRTSTSCRRICALLDRKLAPADGTRPTPR